MPDRYTEVTRQSWFSRLASSIIGGLMGLVLFVLSFPVLFWNEGRAVQTARGLKEGAKVVASVSADEVVPENDGKLVHMTGEARTDETLVDEQFGVSVRAIRLTRHVEMYQWVEHKESHSRETYGGDTETVTTYSYTKQWSTDLVRSNSFKMPEGHANPSTMRFSFKTSQANVVTLGAFQLSKGLVDQITGSNPINVNPDDLPATLMRQVAVQDGGYYTPVPDPAVGPRIGDIRIRFATVEPTTVSIMAQQAGKSFSPYATRAGDALLLLEMGTHTADNMIALAVARNNMLTWILRLVGVVMCCGGLFFVFETLPVVASVLPILGDIVRTGTVIVAGVLGLSLSLVTIGVAWIFYRPLLGIPLLIVGVGGGGAWIFMQLQRRQTASESTSSGSRTRASQSLASTSDRAGFGGGPLMCPKCLATVMVSKQAKNDVQVDVCPDCRGIWMEAGELEAVLKNRGSIGARVKRLADSASEGDFVCPHCESPMHEARFPNTNVDVDLCESCGGIWLDAGEYRKIAES